MAETPRRLQQYWLVAPKAVVLSPTRELALQVVEAAASFNSSVGLVTGRKSPVDRKNDLDMLLEKSPALIVATPRRLLALCGGGSDRADVSVTLSSVVRFVMDDANRLLDEGFSEDVSALSRLTNKRTQTMMFTAVWSKRETEALAGMLRPGAVHITAAGVPKTFKETEDIVDDCGDKMDARRRRRALS